jgi:hypothetical protein
MKLRSRNKRVPLDELEFMRIFLHVAYDRYIKWSYLNQFTDILPMMIVHFRHKSRELNDRDNKNPTHPKIEANYQSRLVSTSIHKIKEINSYDRRLERRRKDREIREMEKAINNNHEASIFYLESSTTLVEKYDVVASNETIMLDSCVNIIDSFEDKGTQTDQRDLEFESDINEETKIKNPEKDDLNLVSVIDHSVMSEVDESYQIDLDSKNMEDEDNQKNQQQVREILMMAKQLNYISSDDESEMMDHDFDSD